MSKKKKQHYVPEFHLSNIASGKFASGGKSFTVYDIAKKRLYPTGRPERIRQLISFMIQIRML